MSPLFQAITLNTLAALDKMARKLRHPVLGSIQEILKHQQKSHKTKERHSDFFKPRPRPKAELQSAMVARLANLDLTYTIMDGARGKTVLKL